MSWHGVPYTTGSQLGHTHLQLTGRKHLINDHLVDITLIAHLQRTHVSNDSLFLGDLLARILLVSGGGIEIELSRACCIITAEHYVTVATTDVQSLFVAELEHLVTNLHLTGTADIKDTYLTTGRKERSLQRIDSLQLQALIHGHSTTYNHTVVHTVNHVYLVSCEHLLNQEVTTDSLGIIAFRILGMCGIAHFVICLHNLICLFNLFVFFDCLQRYK